MDKLPLKKNYLLVLGALLMVLISYQLAFKRTLEQWQENSRLKTELGQGSDLSVEPGYLIRKKANIDFALERYRIDTVNFRTRAINEASIIANREQVKLIEVPTEDPLLHTDRFIIQKLIFQGDYFSLLRTLDNIQAIDKIGVVRSVKLRMPQRSQPGVSSQPLMELYLLCAK